MKIISLYIYNNNFMNSLIIDLYNFINNNNVNVIYIQKSIQGGPHVNVAIEQENNNLSEYLNKIMRTYKPSNNLNFERIKKQISMVAKLEKRNPNLNLKKDGEIIFLDGALNDIDYKKEIYTSEINIIVLNYITKIALYLEKNGFFQLNTAEQNVILSKLYLNLSLLFKDNPKYGYLSMKSNILYFNSHLESLKSRIPNSYYKRYFEVVNVMEPAEEDFIKEDFSDFLSSNKNSFFQIIVKEINNLFLEKMKLSGELFIENVGKAEDFFTNSNGIEKVHDFHKNFFLNKKFIEQYNTKEFIAYKYTADTLYKLLPQIHVNTLRRQKITKIVSDKVENNYNLTWSEVYNDLNKKLQGS